MPRITQRAKLELSLEQLTELKEVAQSRSAPHREVQRARILWLYSEGAGFTAIAKEVGMARKNVYKCVDKGLAMGIKSALRDLARPGKVPEIGEEARAWVRHLACVKPKELGYAAELWTRQALATHVRKHCVAQGHPALARAAKATVQRILCEAEIRPDKIRYYLERRDPDFIPKMKEVLIVYREIALAAAQGAEGVKNAEGKTIYTVSADEKPGVQALATVAPDLPPAGKKHPAFARDYEYKRMGTASILAALDLQCGHVCPPTTSSNPNSPYHQSQYQTYSLHYSASGDREPLPLSLCTRC
jgi:transposase